MRFSLACAIGKIALAAHGQYKVVQILVNQALRIISRPMTPGLQEALRRAGSPSKLAEKLGVSRQAVSKWESVPTRHIIAIERATGVHRSLLRPDLYVEPGQKINL